MKYFTIEELMRSETALRRGIVNVTESPFVVQNLCILADCVLDPLREAVGFPIVVESGYRCPELNRILGGVQDSQHLVGRAVDIRPVRNHEGYSAALGTMFGWIVDHCSYDQIIYYPKRGFIHVSYVSVVDNRQQTFIRSSAW